MELLLEILLQLLLEVGLDAGLEMLTKIDGANSRKRVPEVTDSWFFVVTGLFVVGALLGGLSLVFWPKRALLPGPIPGLSMILAPATVGGVMHLWGRYRTARGHATTTLATFAGGGAFALGTAVVRFLGAH